VLLRLEALEDRLVMDAAHWIPYQGDLNGGWSESNHWSIGRQPAVSDDVFIDAPGNYTVTIDTTANMHNFTLNSTNATLAVSSSPYIETVNTTGAAQLLAGHVLLNGHWMTTGTGTLENRVSITVHGTNASIELSFSQNQGGSLRVEGSNASGDARLTMVGSHPFTNAGAIVVESMNGGYASVQSMNGGVNPGTGGPRRLQGSLSTTAR
jgi:hypothetical protein